MHNTTHYTTHDICFRMRFVLRLRIARFFFLLVVFAHLLLPMKEKKHEKQKKNSSRSIADGIIGQPGLFMAFIFLVRLRYTDLTVSNTYTILCSLSFMKAHLLL